MRGLGLLKNTAPDRLRWFDRHFDWRSKRVLDLGCAAQFMAEAMEGCGAPVYIGVTAKAVAP